MSSQPSRSETSSIRATRSVQRRPAAVGKIEKARDPRNALIRLMPYLKPFTALLVIVFACVVIYTLLGLVGPYLMGVAIDRFIIPKQPDGLGLIALLMLVTYFFNNLFQIIFNFRFWYRRFNTRLFCKLFLLLVCYILKLTHRSLNLTFHLCRSNA